MTTQRSSASFSRSGSRSAAALVADARVNARAGAIPEAVSQYEEAIHLAEKNGEPKVLIEALRRLGAICCNRGELDRARTLCGKSHEIARSIGSPTLAAEALNVLGTVELAASRITDARLLFERALELSGTDRDIRARAEGNLGVVANTEGDLDGALTHYLRSLEASREAGDHHSCGIAYVNLGIVATQLSKFDEADDYFTRCREIAESFADIHLQGQCLVNHAKVHIARQSFEVARRNAESALAIFDQLGDRANKAEAYRMIGVVYRETGRSALAESRLKSAIELAQSAEFHLTQAESSRELAILYHSMGRNQDALSLLNSAHNLFGDIHASKDLYDVDSRVAELEGTYLALVKEWGQSIESSDTYTYGHCGRVADNAILVAKELGLEGQELTGIQLGAYLHDVGKVKVPHEVLNKPGPLTRDEFEIVKMHPVWGVELLEEVEFPWDIKAVIRWHHEKADGTGYPDRLTGDEIPLSAQIVGIVDVYDALTTDRPYRPALSRDEAIAEITRIRASWSDEVYEAFVASVGQGVAAA
ncbi:MAG TPA: tetratricopeptide repeat protein [Gemmatimonadaceae bacterium]